MNKINAIYNRLHDIYGTAAKFHYEITAALLTLILIIQRTALGMRYFPVSDDWFLYYGRYISGIPLSSLNVTTRPFAGLLDQFFVAPLSEHLIIVQLVLILMMGLAAYWFMSAFSMNRIGCGAVAAVFIFMSPIGFEGTYWIAAAIRIVPSVLALAAAAYTLTIYAKTNRTKYFILYGVSSVFAVGFYETFIPVYIILSLAIVYINKFKGKRALIITGAVIVLIGIYYIVNGSDPDISGRTSTVKLGTIVAHTGYTFKMLWEMFFTYGMPMTYDAFTDGISVIRHNAAALGMLIISTVLFSVFAKRHKHSRCYIRNIIIAVLLIGAGAAVNFVIGYVRIPFRLSVSMLVGIGILVEVILSCGFNDIAYRCSLFVITMVFSICSMGSLSLYKRVYDADMEHVTRLVADSRLIDPDHVVFICNDTSYRYSDRVQYYEYVKSVSDNYAGLTAMVRYLSGATDINNVVPLCEGSILGDGDYTSSYMDMLYFDKNGELQFCNTEPSGDDYIFTGNDGALVGTLTKRDDGSYVYTVGEEFK